MQSVAMRYLKGVNIFTRLDCKNNKDASKEMKIQTIQDARTKT
jgi:hypothetical protein